MVFQVWLKRLMTIVIMNFFRGKLMKVNQFSEKMSADSLTFSESISRTQNN